MWNCRSALRRSAAFFAATVALTIGLFDYWRRNISVQNMKPVAARETFRSKVEELPEEILLLIFQALHDGPIPKLGHPRAPDRKALARYDRGVRSIKNVRLTCRLFNRVGSEVLFKFVGVDLSLESLDRLQRVMGHPAFGKGVEMVRIRLTLYNTALYRSRDRWAERIFSEVDGIRDNPKTHPEVRSLLRPYILGRPYPYTPTVPPEPLFQAMREAHGDYKRRYEAQFRIEKGSFVQEIAKALLLRDTRRPLRLEITDSNDFTWLGIPGHLLTTRNVFERVMRPNLQPSSWRTVNSYSDVPRGVPWLVPRILEALADDRISITHLRLTFSSTRTSDPTVFGNMDKRLIRATMRNVQHFTYIIDERQRGRAADPGLSSLLYDCLPPASLRSLRLTGEDVRLGANQLPNLSKIRLAHIMLDTKELGLLLRPLEPHRADIRLTSCVVEWGSWVDVLDLLRAKQRKARLVGPEGWELDALFPTMPFLPSTLSYLAYVEDANEYIKGSSETNPLLVESDE